MKYGLVVLLLVAGALAPRAAKGQAEVYGHFSTSIMNNGTTTREIYGGTVGVVVDGPTAWHHMLISADVQGRLMGTGTDYLRGVTVGPRFSFPMKKHGLTPYAEFMVGFARYNYPPDGVQSTDDTFQINGGVAKQVSPHFDVVVDFSYSQYGYNNGEYNPKTIGAGVVYHFVKR